jgi:hypothetical protein
VEWLTPLATLLGVWLGGWLTHAAGEEKWVREARLDRYSRLLRQVDKIVEAIDDFLEVRASPQQYSSEEEWQAESDKRGATLGQEVSEMKSAAAEVSLFASKRVSDAAALFLDQLAQFLSALAEAHSASEPTADPSTNGLRAEQPAA